MLDAPPRIVYKHGLAFLATIAFVGGFFGARIFHTLFPEVMVITAGIHFHHFWYGLTMLAVVGWLGIAYNDERLDRIYAVVFGVGLGFIGDEVGLLLTFGDYNTELTFDFFVAAIAFILIATLLTRYRKHIVRDVLGLGWRERTSHVGIFLLGFSAVFFAFGAYLAAVPVAMLGLGLFLWGFERGRSSAGSTG